LRALPIVVVVATAAVAEVVVAVVLLVLLLLLSAVAELENAMLVDCDADDAETPILSSLKDAMLVDCDAKETLRGLPESLLFLVNIVKPMNRKKEATRVCWCAQDDAMCYVLLVKLVVWSGPQNSSYPRQVRFFPPDFQ
jgi:hypothetical protein